MNTASDPVMRPHVGDDAATFDIYRYLRVLRKRAWIIAAVVALGVTTAVLYTMRQPKIYRATAKVQIDPQPPQVFGSQVQEVIQLGTGSYWSNQEYYNTQIEILNGYDLALETAVALDLHLDPKQMPRGLDPGLSDAELKQIAAEIVDGAVEASQQMESRIVKVSASHTNPAFAVKLANTHAQIYRQHVLGMRMSGNEDASTFLRGEREKAEAKLRESERELYAFKQDNDILSVSLEDKQNILAADLARYAAALGDARIKRIELASLRKRAQALAGEDILESPIFALASTEGAYAALKDQYVREKHRLAELSEDLGPRHPGFLSQNKKVDELYVALQGEGRRAARELDERFGAAVASEQQFKAEVDRLKAEALELGPQIVKHNELLRAVKNNEQNYELLMGRLTTSELSQSNDDIELINVHKPSYARDAALVSPRLRLNLAVASLLSLLVGVGLAFFLDYMDRTLKTAEDVEAAVGAPLLGLIPIVGEGVADAPDTRSQRDLWVYERKDSAVAESCRAIRTNILFSSVERDMRSLTISSPLPGEGKTMSTIALGITMALSEQRVLLVDADMRKPRLGDSLIDAPRAAGLSDAIGGTVELDDVIQQSVVPGLWVLPCGTPPPNPAELLLTDRFKHILAELEKRFDRVLIDSPPLLAVTDAAVLARLSDGVILVAQGGKTSTDHAARATRSLRDVDAHILGVILNNMDLSEHGYGYGYGYYRYRHASAESDAPSTSRADSDA